MSYKAFGSVEVATDVLEYRTIYPEAALTLSHSRVTQVDVLFTNLGGVGNSREASAEVVTVVPPVVTVVQVAAPTVWMNKATETRAIIFFIFFIKKLN
ncbi:TPA: hypothetical protein DEG21_06110 [Patescibacteria group bacterium]|nr:hypothetical protein [Candidatus Gracilibacteria bacterium]HBY75381.1 hypothetical protein [Candidatus Gracilibacteria bacterium]